jgi:hypothetical protein
LGDVEHRPRFRDGRAGRGGRVRQPNFNLRRRPLFGAQLRECDLLAEVRSGGECNENPRDG